MTTLNARANQAWREVAGGEPYSNAGFGNERAAFEEGWETGYKAARQEIAEALEAKASDTSYSEPEAVTEHLLSAAQAVREIGGAS